MSEYGSGVTQDYVTRSQFKFVPAHLKCKPCVGVLSTSADENLAVSFDLRTWVSSTAHKPALTHWLYVDFVVIFCISRKAVCRSLCSYHQTAGPYLDGRTRLQEKCGSRSAQCLPTGPRIGSQVLTKEANLTFCPHLLLSSYCVPILRFT
jgi:hypothetical protein